VAQEVRLCESLTYEEITQVEYSREGFDRLVDRSLTEYLTIFQGEAPSLEDYCCWIANSAATARD